jgi:hypothetical protein
MNTDRSQESWDVIDAAVKEIATQGYFEPGGGVKIGREARRTIMRMEKDLTTDWRQGKPIQRKQNLNFVPLVWSHVYGVDLNQPTPPRPRELVLPPVKGHEIFARIVAEQAVMRMAGAPMTGQGSGYVTSNILMAVHTTLYPMWTYMKASQLGDPNVFSVHDSLVEKLLNTDIDNVRPEDVRLPFPGLYVSFPFGEKVLLLRNQETGMHEISFVGIAEGSINGERSLFCTFWGEPKPGGRGTSDDHIYSFSFGLPDETGSTGLVALLERGDARQRQEMRDAGIPILIDKDMARLYDQSFDFFDAVGLLRRFVVNFCLYLSSPNPDIAPVRRGQPQWTQTVAEEPQRKRTKVRVSKKRRTSRRKVKLKAAQYVVWEVGQNIERLKRRSSATDILVRGHFRRQAYGPGRKQRKIIWIEPHIRLPTEEGKVPGHEYEVIPNA